MTSLTERLREIVPSTGAFKATSRETGEVAQSGEIDEMAGSWSMEELEAFLREESGSLADLAREPRNELRVALFEVSPLGPLTLAILAGTLSPRQAFLKLIDEVELSRLMSSARVLGDHLALAVAWDASGQTELAASLMGLLLRLGLAGGSEAMVVRTVSRLTELQIRSPECAALSFSQIGLKKVRKAWRIWGTSPQASDPQTLMRLVRIMRRQNDAIESPVLSDTQDEALELDEIAVLERMLEMSQSQTFGFSQGQRSRAMFRLMELYGSASLGWAETSLRGLDLVPIWARACAQRAVPPRDIAHVVQLALFFERQLREAGAVGSRRLLCARLEEALHALSSRWWNEAELGEMIFEVACLRRELLGEKIDTVECERIARLLGEGERLARLGGDLVLEGRMRLASLEIVARWVQFGDPAAVLIARRLMESPTTSDPTVVTTTALCQLSLNMPGTERQRLHNAHRCRQLADLALSHVDIETMPVHTAHALVLKSLASIAICDTAQSRSMHKILEWLRRAVALLTRQLKRSRPTATQSLLARALMTLSHVQLMEAGRWRGLTRTRLITQALRDGQYAERLFRAVGSQHGAAEALWVLGRIHALAAEQEDVSPRQTHLAEAAACIEAALESLGNVHDAQSWVGSATGGARLKDTLRIDLVQLHLINSTAPRIRCAAPPERRRQWGPDKVIRHDGQSRGPAWIESTPLALADPAGWSLQIAGMA